MGRILAAASPAGAAVQGQEAQLVAHDEGHRHTGGGEYGAA